MQFIDLKSQQHLIRENLEARMMKVLDHGQYVFGPEIEELEGLLADYVGVKHCLGVSSGTDALLIALMALDVGAGDEVITTPFSFFATVEVIQLVGATPVFVDIEAKSYNIAPELIERRITSRTKAILPVSLYGQCADFTSINEIAARHGIPVVEDGAQSFGATQNGVRSCGLTEIGCTSFFPSKPLGAYGDGGACFTNDDDLAAKMREIRVHGESGRYLHKRVGLNGRLDSIQAAVLLEKFELFPEEIHRRAEIGALYTQLINGKLAGRVTTPSVADYNTSVFGQYTISVEDRSKLISHLAEQGIPTAIHYPKPLYRQEAMRGYCNSVAVDDFKNTEHASESVMSLPMHPYLTDKEIEKVALEMFRALEK